MKKLFLFAVAASFAVASVASTPGDDKKKDKCESKAACCKTAKAEANSKEKKCCKGDAAKCSDKKAESSAAKAEEKK